MRSKSLTVAILLSLTPSSHGFAQGAHGGRVLQNSNRSAEVMINPTSRSVTVYVKRTSEGTPQAVSVTLYDAEGKAATFDVSAVSSASRDFAAYAGKIPGPPKAGGELSFSDQSAVGIELRIPLSKNKTEVLKSTPP